MCAINQHGFDFNATVKIDLGTTPAVYYLYMQLDKPVLEHLWDSVREGSREKKDYKQSLAANISESFCIKVRDNLLFKNACLLAVKQHLSVMKKPPTRFNTIYK